MQLLAQLVLGTCSTELGCSDSAAAWCGASVVEGQEAALLAAS